MSARIVLHIDTGLAPEEVAHLKQILRDAFGEFIGARSGAGPDNNFESALAYIAKRYPEMGVAERARKADEVMLRKAIARKLRRAADEVIIESITPVAERECVVLPTVFPQSVEEETKILQEVLAEAKLAETSPLAAYTQARPVEPPEIAIETFEIPPRKRDE